MRKLLTTVPALACVLVLDVSQAETSEAPLEEIVVTGEFAGPGMWQVTHPNYPGHTLWIVGDPPPLPSRLRWHSQKVERVAAQSQEIILEPGISVQPDEKIGVFRALTLVPAALKARKNPDKAKLQDLIPPDTYARWLVLKKRFLGRDSGVEEIRPFLAAMKLNDAAIKQLQLREGGAVFNVIAKLVNGNKIPVTNPNREFTFKADEVRAKLKAFSHEKLADAECFAQTVALVEALSDEELEESRARAWATADLAKLEELPPLPNPEVSCFLAIMNSQAVSGMVPANLREQMDEMWFDVAGKALTKNESTLAIVKLDVLIGDHGYLESLRQRGYEIVAPVVEKL